MNQPIELQRMGDLSQYMANMNKRRSLRTFDEKHKLYLYVFNKNSDTCHLRIDTKHKDGRYLSYQDVRCHIDAGTMHFGMPMDVIIRAKDPPYTHLNETQGNQKLGWTASQETGWGYNPHVKQDVGDIIHLKYAVVHELKPGATRFENISRKIEENPDGTHNTFHMVANPTMFDEVRVFDIGDIGYELSDMTPEQAAEKYFGVSDFRQLFSNYAAASKQMSLKNHPHVRRYYDHDDDLRSHVGLSRIAPKGIQLTGMHPVKPSSLREYLKAGKQLLIRQKGLAGAAAGAGAGAAFAAGIGAAAAAAAGAGAADRRFSAMAMAAMSSFPLLGTIHSRIREQQELNALQRKKTVALTNEERKKLFAKGALASELTRRLTTTPPQSRPDLFKHIHSTVHQKPKSARIHWSPGKKGGRKIRRTRKK
jgi:hypothetical protein